MADELYPNYKDIDEFVTSMFDYAKVTDPFDCDMPQHECAVQSILQASKQDEEIERLTARNKDLEVVLEAAILFKDATDRVRLTAIDNAIDAVKTTEQECDHLTNGKMYAVCKKCGAKTGGSGTRYPDGTPAEKGQTE